MDRQAAEQSHAADGAIAFSQEILSFQLERGSRGAAEGIVGRLVFKINQAMDGLNKTGMVCIAVGIALIFSIGSFLWRGIEFQPSRPRNTVGWMEGPIDDITNVGQFVLAKGESTDNGRIGVTLHKITSKPCPSATICLEPDAKVTLTFYRPSDHAAICETTLESSSTSYVTKAVCPGLPFTNIGVSLINTRDQWAVIAFFDADKSNERNNHASSFNPLFYCCRLGRSY